jgi:hypothetical protein
MAKCQICNLDQFALNFKLCIQHGFIICKECAKDRKIGFKKIKFDNEGIDEL